MIIFCLRRCHMTGSDLLQVYNSVEETLILSVLSSRKNFSLPVMPGYFHLGLHQRQSGNQLYYRNGVRV